MCVLFGYRTVLGVALSLLYLGRLFWVHAKKATDHGLLEYEEIYRKVAWFSKGNERAEFSSR